uniref:Translation initiation factor IF-3, mitochondrial n=1 Tax=Sus scrofa TaxID=9823 RepID=A0A8D1JQN0_PIG
MTELPQAPTRPPSIASHLGNKRVNFHELLSLLFRMAALFLKRLTFQTIRTETSCTARCLGERVGQKTSPAPPHPVASAPRPSCLIHAKAFSTEDTQEERKKKKKDETAFSNIGRKIHERIIHVLDEQGNDLGHMHRANVIRLMAERDLRLVRRDPGAEPPQYQLLTGAQIHQERLRLREAGRAEPKPGPTLTKELTFSSNIGQHDLDTKSKQIQQWIEKKYKVQITIKKGRNAEEPENKMEELCNQILQTMPGIATFSSRPQLIRGGKAMMCVLRPLSRKEEANRAAQGPPRGDPLSREDGNHGASDVLHQ